MGRGGTAILAPRPLEAATVAALRSVANRFGSAERPRKLALLRVAADAAICDTEVLLAYHDVLLFLLAYPDTAAMRSLASRELARVAASARDIEVHGPARARARLRGSGIAWSEITITYSYPIARWLVSRYPRRLSARARGAHDSRVGGQGRYSRPLRSAHRHARSFCPAPAR
jgi:hypothetical protein